jgi:hypothetical protein
MAESLMFYRLHAELADRSGPYLEDRIRELIRRRDILSHTPLRRSDTEDKWLPASEFFPDAFPDGRVVNEDPTPPQSDHAAWYYADDGGDVLGPVTLVQMKVLCEEGGVTSSSLVFKDGWPQWRPASGIPVVSGFLSA